MFDSQNYFHLTSLRAGLHWRRCAGRRDEGQGGVLDHQGLYLFFLKKSLKSKIKILSQAEYEEKGLACLDKLGGSKE